MANYVWVITHVNTAELGEDMADEVGIAGPRGATPEMIERARKEGMTFRMRDDDDIWYYKGKLWFEGIKKPGCTKAEGWRTSHLCTGMGGDEMQEFAPLTDFGTPNAGCAHIDYRCHTTDDEGDPVYVWAAL